MANKSTTFTKFDRNRFRKIYPRIKFPESISFKSSASIVIESKTFDFNNVDSVTGNLTQKYYSIPNMVIGVKSESNQDKLNVNVFISSIDFNAATNTVQVTIKSSAKFTGEVDLQTLSIT